MIDASDGPFLHVFSAVARCGSFSAAALELKLSKSVVSERIKHLEERAGVRLLERTTRRVQLTDSGAQVLAAATTLQDALGQLTSTLDAARSEPTGVLRISTTNDLGPLLVAPVVARFVRAYAKVTVEVFAEDVQRDFAEQRIDIAVRLGAPKSSSLVLQKLATLNEPIVAAPSLGAMYRAANRPRDLAKAPWVRHALISPRTLNFTGPAGAVDEVSPQWRASANSGATMLSLLLNGAGIGVFPEHALREHLRQGLLVELCPGWIWKTVSLYAVTASRPSQRPILKAFVTMLKEHIALDKTRFGLPLR